MVLSRLTKITGPGINTDTNWVGNNANYTGIVTATSFSGSGAALTGIDATAIKDSGGNVKVQAQASGAVYTGIHTFSSSVKVGGATTFTEDLVVTGNARVTGILTVGTGSLTITDRDIKAVGVITGANFKSGSTNVHNVGVEAAGINVLGADTPIGTGATIYNSGDVVSKAGAEYQGIVTASKFVGDGSDLTGISGFSTALSNTANTLENLIFKTPFSYTIGTGTSVTVESDAASGSIAFTRLNRIIVSSGATFRVASGTRFMMDILKLNP